MGKRSLLKTRDVDKSHFSSGSIPPELKSIISTTRCVVKILSASNLLASDADTGKSDPTCFIWFGSDDLIPNFYGPLDDSDITNQGIMQTAILKATIDPIWNEEVIFPIDMSNPSLTSIINTKLIVHVKDWDIEDDGAINYESLGYIELSFKDIFSNGKLVNNNSISDICRQHTLKAAKGMRKVDGTLKMSVSLIFESDSNPILESRNCKTFKELYDIMTKTLKPSAAADTSLSTSNSKSMMMLNTARSSFSPLLTGRRSLSAERDRERRSLGNTSRSSSTPRIASIRPLSAGKDNFKLNDTAKLLELSLPKAIPEVSSEKEIDEDANILSELESWKLLNNVAEETKSSIQNLNRDDAEIGQENKTGISTSSSEPPTITTTTTTTTTMTKNLNERSDNTSTFSGYLITITDVMIEGTKSLSIESKNSILNYLEKNSNKLISNENKTIENPDVNSKLKNSDISPSKVDDTNNNSSPLKITDDAMDHPPSEKKEEIKHLASDKLSLGWSVHLNDFFSLNSTKFIPWEEDQITPSSNLKLIDSLDISDHYINEKISAAAISNNKTTIATSSISDVTVQLRKTATFKDKEFISFKDKEVIIFSGHTATVRSIIFRPDDLQLATASDDKSIKLWDILSRNCTLTFSEHASSVNKMLYNSKGTELVSCSVDSIIKVWNIVSGNVLTSIDSHQRSITSLVSQSEHKIFSGSADKSLKIWDYSSGNMIKSFDNLPGVVTSIAVSSNGSHIIYAISNVKDGEYNSTIKIMDDNEYKELCSLDIKGVVMQLTHLNGNEDQILVCVKHNDDDSKYEYMLYSFGQELKLLSKVEYHIKNKPDSNMKPTEHTSFIQEILPGNNEALKEPDSSSSSSSSSSAHSNTDIYSKVAINSFELNDLSFYSLFLAKNIEIEITTPILLENIALYLKSHLMSFHLNHNQPSTIQSNNLHPLVWENIQESSFDIKIDTATTNAAAAADLSSGDKSSPIIPIQFDLCVNNTDDTDVSKFHRLGRGLANLPLLTTDISSKAKTAKIKIENLKFDFKIENLNQENIVAYICFKISQKSNLEKYLEGKLSSEEKIEPEIQPPPNLMYSEGDSALPDFEEDELNVLPSSSSSSSNIKEINKIENSPDKIIKPTIPSLPIKSEININPDKILPSKTKTSTVSTRRQSKVIEAESVEIEEATPYDDESESILLNEKKTGKKPDVSKDKKSDQKAVKTNGGGNVGTVRALKELAQQREKLEKALNDIKKSTRESIGKLTKRVQELESNSKSQSASQPSNFSVDAGDEFLPPEILTEAEGKNNKNGTFNHEILTKTRKEKEKEKEGLLLLSKANSIDLNGDPSYSLKTQTPDRSTNLSRTTPGRIQSNYINPNISASPKSLEMKKELNENDFDWDELESRISVGEVSTCFESVIKFGTLDDLGRLMELLGPHPEAISVSIRNRVYEGVSLMLHAKKSVERNLVWILALVRTGLIDTLVRHTQYDIASGLLHIAEEASKRGMLAALLEESIKNQQKSR